ncbi:MAG TPA: hypothetical protein PLV58_06930 [Campylobacterales bacterium]|nr:hypothetical protein [Campylobacterales bacterium]
MVKKLIIASFLLVGSANAGMFDSVVSAVGGGGSSSSSISGSDVKGVISSFQDAEKSLFISVDLVNKALADKQEVAKLEELQKTVSSMPDGAEKDAKTKEIQSSSVALAEKTVKSEKASKDAQKLSTAQKQKVAVSTFNILLALLKDKEALSKAQNLVSSISSNPTSAVQFAGDLPKLKDIVSTVPNQIDSLTTLGSGLMKLAKTAKISVAQPASASESMKPVAAF